MKPGEKEVNTLLRNEASCLFFFKPPIRFRSPLLTGSRLISLPLATKMFQFAKFSKSKERRLAAELGYGLPIGDPWITDGISPWPFAKASFLLNARASIQCILFDLVPSKKTNECANAAFASIPCLFASHRLHKRYTEDQPNLDENQYTQLHLQIQRASERTLCH